MAMMTVVLLRRTILVDNNVGIDYGIVSSDGSIFALVDAVESGDGDNSIVFAVGIQKSMNMDNSLFAGNYWLGQMAQNISVVPYVDYTSQVDVTSNGAGAGSAYIARHSLGSAGATVPFAYVVNADGSYSVKNGGGNDYGMISANGQLFFAVDADKPPTDNDEEIVFALGLRK